ncbi:MAG: signal peptidase II [Chloroflexi bacterium]|nr:signal peptidase II [Chloroflexota bacterium]
MVGKAVPVPGAVARRYKSLLPFGVALVVFALDQATKIMAASYLGSANGREHLEVIGSWLRFAYVTNSGAAFGILQDRTTLFTIIAFLAIPILIFFHNSLPSGGWIAKICVGLLLGGTLGNLVDRVRFGYVVDFIDVGVGNLRWPTFNVADSAFVIGVFVLATYFLTSSEARRAG